MTAITRSIAGAGLALSLALGGWVASRLTLDTAVAIDTTIAKQIPPAQAQRQALELELSHATSEAYHQATLDDALARYGVAAPERERLLAPNTFFHVASPDDPRFLAPGAGLRKGGLELKVVVEVIEVERRGISTKSEHTLIKLENVGASPLAYFLDLRSRSGDCQTRALTRFNIMALRPGEIGELSVCAGAHEVEIEDLRIMEVTEIGAVWVSKIPARAVGHDEIGARSHYPGPGVEPCTEISATELARRLEAREVAWEDIIDFYSRHDCDHYRWFAGYTRIVEPLAKLPAVEG
jgi:hypothetical protein